MPAKVWVFFFQRFAIKNRKKKKSGVTVTIESACMSLDSVSMDLMVNWKCPYCIYMESKHT